jgi:hypothetical protein
MHSKPRPIRQRLVVATSALGVLVAMALPAVASAAGTASVTSYGLLTYVDLSTSANHLTVAPLGSGQFRVVDTAGVSVWPGCTKVSATEAKCSNVTSMYVSVAGGDDDVAADVGAATSPNVMVLGGSGADRIQTGAGVDTIYGSDGADTIDPGPGADTVDAGAGADTISARDGAVDNVKCGSEYDTGTIDANDKPDADCEALDGAAAGALVGTTPVSGDPAGATTSTSSGGTDSPSGGGTSTPIAKVDPLANPLPVLIPAQSATFDSKGNAAVRVACPAGVGRCKGTVTLEVAVSDLGKARAAAAGTKLEKVGSARFTAKAGTKPVVRVRMSRRGRRRVIRGRKRQHCRMTVSTTSPTGKTLVSRRTITLVAARRTANRGSRR